MIPVFNTLNLNPKTLFLLDGIGALLSALFLGTVLVRFEAFFGMPRVVLYPLATIAGGFAVYSFCCYAFVIQNRPVFLRVIATANLLYGCVTVGLLVLYHQELTLWGWGYFLGELMIIGLLVALEFKAASVE